MRFVEYLLAASLVMALGACTTESSTTPTCSNDPGATDKCDKFAVCAEAPDDPKQCCKVDKDHPFTGDDLKLCLYGFGAGPAPSGSGGSGGTGGGAGGTGGTGGTGGGTGGTGGGTGGTGGGTGGAGGN